MVVISTRQELGAKTLSHHSGLTSIFFAGAVALVMANWLRRLR